MFEVLPIGRGAGSSCRQLAGAPGTPNHLPITYPVEREDVSVASGGPEAIAASRWTHATSEEGGGVESDALLQPVASIPLLPAAVPLHPTSLAGVGHLPRLVGGVPVANDAIRGPSVPALRGASSTSLGRLSLLDEQEDPLQLLSLDEELVGLDLCSAADLGHCEQAPFWDIARVSLPAGDVLAHSTPFLDALLSPTAADDSPRPAATITVHEDSSGTYSPLRTPARRPREQQFLESPDRLDLLPPPAPRKPKRGEVPVILPGEDLLLPPEPRNARNADGVLPPVRRRLFE